MYHDLKICGISNQRPPMPGYGGSNSISFRSRSGYIRAKRCVHDGAEVVRDDAYAIESQRVDEAADVFGHLRVRVAGFRRQVRLVGVAEAPHVGHHHVEPLR